MKYLLIIFLLLSPSLSWSEDIDWNDLVKRDGLYYEKFTDVPFTGDVVGRQTGNISKGKKEGEWLVYRENGRLKAKDNFKDGKREGEQLIYWGNGQLKLKSSYKDGKADGIWIYHDYDGNVDKDISGTYKNGKRVSD